MRHPLWSPSLRLALGMILANPLGLVVAATVLGTVALATRRPR
jgi:hypothetical protein